MRARRRAAAAAVAGIVMAVGAVPAAASVSDTGYAPSPYASPPEVPAVGEAGPVPGPHPSQDGGERAELGATGADTPLALAALALLLSGTVLLRVVHTRRRRR